MSQVDNRNSSAVKRARTDGNRREDDWRCPSCGNLNFAFRTTCNMHNCTQSRPADHNSKPSVKPVQVPPAYSSSVGPGFGASSPLYLGGPPYGSSVFNGSVMPPPYDLPFSGGSGYRYDYSNRFSMGSPYGPLPFSGPSPYSGGPYGTGGMYAVPPLMDRYGLGLPMGHAAMGARPGAFLDENFQKKPTDNGRDGDWVCPKCGNNNFSFRMVCNMRKCNTPKPGSQGPKSENGKGANSKMPEGSWKCEKCSNINYPFRAKCNRHNCGADKPDEVNKPQEQTSEGEEQVCCEICFVHISFCYMDRMFLVASLFCRHSKLEVNLMPPFLHFCKTCFLHILVRYQLIWSLCLVPVSTKPFGVFGKGPELSSSAIVVVSEKVSFVCQRHYAANVKSTRAFYGPTCFCSSPCGIAPLSMRIYVGFVVNISMLYWSSTCFYMSDVNFQDIPLPLANKFIFNGDSFNICFTLWQLRQRFSGLYLLSSCCKSSSDLCKMLPQINLIQFYPQFFSSCFLLRNLFPCFVCW